MSAGQKQLILFARALAHNPKILVQDEATSSVDTETEIRVRAALTRMVEGSTSVIIAHRLSTIQRADKIIVMHKGHVREIGSHQELLAQRGIYWSSTSFSTKTRNWVSRSHRLSRCGIHLIISGCSSRAARPHTS
jgi:ATP-binding cassette subfamily B protein